MGLKGFRCPRTNSNISFGECFSSCTDRCLPLPVLVAMADGQREVVPNHYSVTEILKPPQVVWLGRNTDYYTKPESLIWATFGTAWHTVMEKRLALIEDDFGGTCFSSEEDNEFSAYFPESGGTLHGKPDLYDNNLNILYDYKTAKVYTVKKMKAGQWDDSDYMHQLNMYRAFRFPECEKMELVCAVKDHSPTAQERDGVHAVEMIEVPMMDTGKVMAMAESLVAEHISNQLDPRSLRSCRAGELWVNKKGIPLRCRDYCSPSENCPQYEKTLRIRNLAGWFDGGN